MIQTTGEISKISADATVQTGHHINLKYMRYEDLFHIVFRVYFSDSSIRLILVESVVISGEGDSLS